jgi:hypothetical protein
MRVRNDEHFDHIVLSAGLGWSEERFTSMVGFFFQSSLQTCYLAVLPWSCFAEAHKKAAKTSKAIALDHLLRLGMVVAAEGWARQNKKSDTPDS